MKSVGEMVVVVVVVIIVIGSKGGERVDGIWDEDKRGIGQ